MKTSFSLLEQTVRALLNASSQAALLILFVAVLAWLLRRSQPVVRYALWSVVLFRLCLPFGFTSPIGLPRPVSPALHATASPSALRPPNIHPAQFQGLPPVDRIETTRETKAPGEPPAKIVTPMPVRLTPWAWCGLAWLAGVMALGGLILLRWSRLSRIVRNSKASQRPELGSLLGALRSRLGMAREVTLKVLPAGAETFGPCAAGWRHPLILLPAKLAETWDLATIEPILLHELAHIRRADVVVNAVQVVVQVVYWFHPLVWLANARLRKERELICDDFAVLHSGATSQRYGATILRALEEVRPEAGWSLAGVGMGESGLAQRLRRLLDRGYVLPRPVNRVALLALFMVGMLGVLVASEAPLRTSASDTAHAPATGGMIAAHQPVPPAPAPDFIRRPFFSPVEDPADPRALAVSGGLKGEFSGRIVDRAGQPVAGVLVDAWDWCPGDETHSAADGTFRLTKLDPDERIEVRFIKEGFAPYTVIKQPLGTLAAPLVLDEQTRWEGVVTGPDGQPVADAWIRADQGPQQADGVVISSIWTETHSDSQGHYRLRVQGDAYELQVTAPGGLAIRLPKRAIAAGQVEVLDFKLAPGVVFRAHLVDSESGGPVAGVTLDNWKHPGVKGTSDAAGNVRIEGLIPGEFEFHVKATGYPPYTRWWSAECLRESEWQHFEKNGWQRNLDSLHYELSPDVPPVTITLEKAVRVRGRVVDPNGQPVAGATAGPALTGTGSSLTGDTRFSVKTGADGTFEMLLPASGNHDYNLIAHDGAYKEWRRWANGISAPFRTKPGQEIDGLELKLTVPATVRGRVFATDGRPVADREVRAHATDLRENRYYDPTTRTDAEGRFELKFIRAGAQKIQAAPFADTAEQTWPVEIRAGQTLESPDLIAPAQLPR